MIKQVIDGKAYNTETARCLATVDLMAYRTGAGPLYYQHPDEGWNIEPI